MEKKEDVAECRNCGKVLNGLPYYRGGNAYHPVTKEACKTNHYGGFVCSARCDYNASLELEQSMPGHGYDQKTIGQNAMRSYLINWPND